MNSIITDEKKALVIEMLKENVTNNKIQAESKLRFKSGIHPEALSQLRKELGIPSPGATAVKAKVSKSSANSEGGSDESSRSQIAQQKKDIALQLLKQDASNKEIQAEILARFGSNIPMVNITTLRREHKIPGKKGKRKTTSVIKTTPKTTPKTSTKTKTTPAKKTKKTGNIRSAKAQKKCDMALGLLQQGASNKEVQAAVKSKFGTGIPMVNITDLRREHKIPGKKGKRKTTTATKKTTKTATKTATKKTTKTATKTKKTGNIRSSKAQKKCDMALGLLQQGASNKEVQAAVKSKFGTGIPMVNITDLRREHKIPGKKGKRAVLAKKMTSTSSTTATTTYSEKSTSRGHSFRVTWEENGSAHEQSCENEAQVRKFIQQLTQKGVYTGSIEGWRKLEKQIQFQFVF